MSTPRRILAVLAGVMVIGAGLAVPGTAIAADRTYTIDCLSGAGNSAYAGGTATDTFTVTLTNCNAISANVPVTPAPINGVPASTITFGMGADVRVSDTVGGLADSETRVRMRTRPAGDEDIPSGVKLATNDFVLPTTANQIEVAATGVGGNGPMHLLGNVPSCELAASSSGTQAHVYSTMDITVTAAGDYTFRGISSSPVGAYAGLVSGYDPLQDPFLALYSSFDPANPDSGVLGCNDDLGMVSALTPMPAWKFQVRADGSIIETHQPYFAAASLAPGFYTLVLMTYDGISTADLQSGSTSFGETFPVQSRSTSFELWGPPGGLLLGHVTPTATGTTPEVDGAGTTTGSVAATLPSTGFNGAPLWVALLALVLGGLVLAVQRLVRRTR